MKILGVDFGMRNTAFCVVDDGKIILWELMSPRDYVIKCACGKTAGWKNDVGEYVCKRDGGKIKYSPDLCDRFLHYLDTKIFPFGVDAARPEIQVSAKNNVLYFIFKMWCLEIPQMKFSPIHSKEKVKWIPNAKTAAECGARGKKRKSRHTYLKNEMVKLATPLVPPEWKNFFDAEIKKDDLAEAYLNAIK